MPRTRTTLTIDEDVLRSARVAAAHRGMKEGELIEEALRRHLGLGAFERIWAHADDPPAKGDPDLAAMSDDELLEFVVAEQHAARGTRRRTRPARGR